MDTYDQAKGPSARGTVEPVDLQRSRRVGLHRDVCAACGATRREGVTSHQPGCRAVGQFLRESTGPLARDETSPWHTSKQLREFYVIDEYERLAA